MSKDKNCPTNQPCGEEIVDTVLCGPAVCIQHKPCEEAVVEEKAAEEKVAAVTKE